MKLSDLYFADIKPPDLAPMGDSDRAFYRDLALAARRIGIAAGAESAGFKKKQAAIVAASGDMAALAAAMPDASYIRPLIAAMAAKSLPCSAMVVDLIRKLVAASPLGRLDRPALRDLCDFYLRHYGEIEERVDLAHLIRANFFSAGHPPIKYGASKKPLSRHLFQPAAHEFVAYEALNNNMPIKRVCEGYGAPVHDCGFYDAAQVAFILLQLKKLRPNEASPPLASLSRPESRELALLRKHNALADAAAILSDKLNGPGLEPRHAWLAALASLEAAGREEARNETPNSPRPAAANKLLASEAIDNFLLALDDCNACAYERDWQKLRPQIASFLACLAPFATCAKIFAGSGSMALLASLAPCAAPARISDSFHRLALLINLENALILVENDPPAISLCESSPTAAIFARREASAAEIDRIKSTAPQSQRLEYGGNNLASDWREKAAEFLRKLAIPDRLANPDQPCGDYPRNLYQKIYKLRKPEAAGACAWTALEDGLLFRFPGEPGSSPQSLPEVQLAALRQLQEMEFARESMGGFFVKSDAACNFDESLRHILRLPRPWPGYFTLKAGGKISGAEFALSLVPALYGQEAASGAVLRGPILEIGGKPYLPDACQWLALGAIKKFRKTAKREEADNLRALYALRLAKRYGASINFGSGAGKQVKKPQAPNPFFACPLWEIEELLLAAGQFVPRRLQPPIQLEPRGAFQPFAR